jgi:Telomere resolvase
MFTPLAYAHDISREEIIARFRDRIAKGERTKLSKQERAELALHFVDRLAKCDTEEAAIALCRSEMALLEEGYPVGSICNQYLPEWRKGIAFAVEEGRLPQQDLAANEFGKVYSHWGLKHLLYPNEVHKALKQKTTAANNQKQDDLQPIRADRFIAKCIELLAGETPYEWAVGLLGVTGRRFSEIVAKGSFSPGSHPYAIAFRGQLKKGIQNLERAQTFLIATLIESDQVLAALDKFRGHPRILELADLSPDELNSRLNTSIRHYIKREFEETELIPILIGEKSVSAHNLRGVYAEIAVHYFCPPSQATHRFVQAHLGHIIGEQELASRKNAGATEHYFHFRLVGAQGRQLNEKGVLLEQFGPLPSMVEFEPEPEQPEVSAIEQETEAMAIAQRQHESQSHPARKSRAQVPSDLMHDLKEIAAHKLNADGTYAEVLAAVVGFLRDDRTPTIATSIESLGTTFEWFTAEVERLREENRQLRAECDQARADLLAVQQQNHDQGEMTALRAENARLLAEVAQFQQIKQMLGGGIGPSAARSRKPGAIAATPRSPQPKPMAAAPQKRLKGEEQALGKIGEAIDLIMAWNDDPVRDFNHKWFISVPAMLSLIRGSGYSASQGRVMAVMAQRKSEMDAHHAKHQLGQRHNTRHDRPITEDLVL